MGLDCPDKGILVRLCFGYVSVDAGTMPLMSGGLPSLLKADRFAEWLALPEEEKEINYENAIQDMGVCNMASN